MDCSWPSLTMRTTRHGCAGRPSPPSGSSSEAFEKRASRANTYAPRCIKPLYQPPSAATYRYRCTAESWCKVTAKRPAADLEVRHRRREPTEVGNTVVRRGGTPVEWQDGEWEEREVESTGA